MTFDGSVFWSGIWNFVLGLILILPPITTLFGVQIPNSFWPWIVAAFLWYTSATLIISSQDVQTFASIIYWEALLRFAAVAILVVYGFRYIGILPATLFAISDFAWGIIYIMGLPRSTGRSHKSLLLNRRVGAAE
ncbi:hypothetical protein M0Q28_06350 [Patescibacteria group bacterium]|jgi:hypothetical protein|nr:hypothetical protein [Patescibacteria group bacterium]